MRVRIKICGIRRPEDLQVSVRAGADMLGFVVDVPSSPRNLTVDEAKELMKGAPPSVIKVVVTVFRDVDHLLELYNALKPDLIQVHGLKRDLRDAVDAALRVPMIRALNITGGLSFDEVLWSIDLFKAVHVDSYVPGMYGGTGVVHDWSMSRRVRDLIYPKPLILAGGLRPENVYEAVLKVRPFAVDVSSGVETQLGVKDELKIVSFIEKVRMAESYLSRAGAQ